MIPVTGNLRFTPTYVLEVYEFRTAMIRVRIETCTPYSVRSRHASKLWEHAGNTAVELYPTAKETKYGTQPLLELANSI